MKKFLSLLLCFVMVFALVACGNSDPVYETDTEDSTGGLFTENGTSESDSDASSNVSSATQDVTESDKTDGASTDAATNSATDSASSNKKPSTDSSSDKNTSSNLANVWNPPSDKGPNLVMANDQIKDRVVIYDFDKYEKGCTLEELEVWDVKAGHFAGLKYREDTVFGDVVLVGGSRSSIIEYPSKKVVWSTNNPGNNTHSVEILPSGNIVLANSTGNSVRMFYTSALLDGNTAKANTYKEYTLAGAHGVLWDPEYDVLWALGNDELIAYSVDGEGSSQTLTQIFGMGGTLPEGMTGGHDLSPDYMDRSYLYVTVNACTLQFDKNEGTFNPKFKDYAQLNDTAVKGFSNNLNNNFFMSVPVDQKSDGGKGIGTGTNFEGHHKAEWLTDTIYFSYNKTENWRVTVPVKSTESGFYKVRAFVGQYQ